MRSFTTRAAALAAVGAALAIALPACGAKSSAPSTTAAAQPTQASTPTAATSSAAAPSTTAATRATTASPSATPALSGSPSAAAASASGALKGVKDPTVAPRFVPYDGMTFASAKFPPTLNKLPQLGTTSNGTANRYASYSQTDSQLSYTAVVAKNGSESDADDLVATKSGVVSYDGGRMKCYPDQANNEAVCQVLLMGSKEIATMNVAHSTGGLDEAAKVMVEWMNDQK